MIATDTTMNVNSINILAWPFKIGQVNASVKKSNSKYSNIMKSTENFKKSVEKTERWKKVEIKDYKNPKSPKAVDQFMVHQYLSDSARDVFTSKQTNTCEIYEYEFKEGEKWEYFLENKNKKGPKQYQLPIDTITLHIYSFGVGILFIQLHNSEYKTIEDIKIINDLSRRIKVPFASDEVKHLICPSKIGIQISGVKSNVSSKEEEPLQIISDFENINYKYYFSGNPKKKKKTDDTEAKDKTDEVPDEPIIVEPCTELELNEFLYGARFLRWLLQGNVNSSSTEFLPEFSYNTIKDFSDDRLFSMTLIRDDELSAGVKVNSLAGIDRDLLYSICYFDNDDSTCQSDVMREESFEKSLYRRWENWGTLSCMTEFSFVTITGQPDDINNSVVKPFILEYTYFFSLVIAQRMGISIFSERAGRLAHYIGKRKYTKKLLSMQKEYITFKNQILILEGSAQQQGIEVYKLMQNQMLIFEEHEILDEQLESLYEVASVSADKALNTKAFWIAIVALVISGFQLVVDIWPGSVNLLVEFVKSLFQ